jgi:uncharacterized lipoprotein YehR (DUF1307 family)
MEKLKKLFAILIVAALALGVSACGNEAQNKKPKT